jgi:alpha-beta hydrolase superfamily lysophospholipase
VKKPLLSRFPRMLRPLPRRRPVPTGYAAGSERPVVILPGVYETWHFMRPIADELNRRGHPVHVVQAMGFNRDPIPATAALVARELRSRDLRDVALVAHSKGGLIGKHLLAYDDPDGRVDRLVALAAPFGGSRRARYTVGSTLRAFLPGDPVIRSLAGELAVNARITSIYPRYDPNIPEGSRLEGAANIELPLWGHFRILTAPASIAAVVDAVEAT